MTVVILQSNYIPWRGYFDLIHDADLFVFGDDVRFTTHDWRNRNRIVTPTGLLWLSIPVGRSLNRLICEVEFANQHWKAKHKRTLQQYYARAPFFKQFAPLLDFLYDNDLTNLSAYNQRAIIHIARLLGLKTAFTDMRALDAQQGKTEGIIEICRKLGASRYLSGPAGASYIDEAGLRAAGIDLVYKDYPDYPVYQQATPEFYPFVSIVDLLFQVGDAAPQYIWGDKD